MPVDFQLTIRSMQSKIYAANSSDFEWRPRGVVANSRAILRDCVLRISNHFHSRDESSFLRCLFLHNVFDDQKQAFEDQIRALKNLGVFVNTNTCLKMLSGEMPIDGPYYHLSMDDGYRNNFQNAMPILQKYEVPAIVFVATDLIGCTWDVAAKFCRDAGCNGVLEMASWSDLKKACDSGFEIGSHTRSHARFSEISSDEEKLKSEILGSKEAIEERLGRSCDFISWPFGTLPDQDKRSIDFVRKVGYKACFGGFRGSVKRIETDPFAIPRHQFEASWPSSHIEYFARGGGERRRGASSLKSERGSQ